MRAKYNQPTSCMFPSCSFQGIGWVAVSSSALLLVTSPPQHKQEEGRGHSTTQEPRAVTIGLWGPSTTPLIWRLYQLFEWLTWFVGLCVRRWTWHKSQQTHGTLFIVCTSCGRANFSFMTSVFWVLRPLPSSVKWIWTVSAILTYDNGSLKCNGHGPSVSCVKWSLVLSLCMMYQSIMKGWGGCFCPGNHPLPRSFMLLSWDFWKHKWLRICVNKSRLVIKIANCIVISTSKGIVGLARKILGDFREISLWP